jgi:hypothetical protein
LPLYPYAAVPRRVPPTSGSPLFTPAMRNVRPEISYEQGPQDGREAEPIVQSDFNFEGKPYTHTNSRAAVAVALNYDSTLGIEEEQFQVVNWARNVWTSTPPAAGGQLAWVERSNVNVPPAVAYGSLFSLPGVG